MVTRGLVSPLSTSEEIERDTRLLRAAGVPAPESGTGAMFVDVTAPTVDSCVQAGMSSLGFTNTDDVVFAVVEEPKPGVLGFGRRPATVRVWSKRPIPLEDRIASMEPSERRRLLRKFTRLHDEGIVPDDEFERLKGLLGA